MTNSPALESIAEQIDHLEKVANSATLNLQLGNVDIASERLKDLLEARDFITTKQPQRVFPEDLSRLDAAIKGLTDALGKGGQ